MSFQNLLKTAAKYFYAMCFLAMVASCADSINNDDGGAALSPGRAVPNSNQFYYGQPKYQQQPYQQPYPPQYQQAPQPAPYYYPQQQQGYYPPQGGSRFYSNPYAIPATTQYPYYDADQYYVPPTYYNNVEPQSSIQAQQRVLSNPGTF
jgi:hypothetical protein